jgi:hypothetical protein
VDLSAHNRKIKLFFHMAKDGTTDERRWCASGTWQYPNRYCWMGIVERGVFTEPGYTAVTWTQKTVRPTKKGNKPKRVTL